MKKLRELLAIMTIFLLLFSLSTAVLAQDDDCEDDDCETVETTDGDDCEDDDCDEDVDGNDGDELPNEPTTTTNNTNKMIPVNQIFVGRGYDATDKYANIDSLRESLFQIMPMPQRNGYAIISSNGETPIVIQNNSATKYDEIFGKSLSEYQKSFSTSTSVSGRYKFFSGSVRVNFSTDESGSTEKDYMTMMYAVTLRSYTLPYDVKNLIKDDARKFIDTANPNDVFRRFGTHFIWQAIVGGRVDYNFQSKAQSSARSRALAVDLKASVNSLFASVSVENQTAYQKSVNEFNKNGSFKIQTHGGDSTSGAQLRGGQAVLADWAKSVERNPTLSRFTDRSLRGIWTLASTPARQKQLEDAFKVYLDSKAIREAKRKLLDIKTTTNFTYAGGNWYSRGSERSQVAYWSPIADPDNGYYVVGHVMTQTNDPNRKPTFRAILVKELGARGTGLRKPISFSKVWGDWGTRGKKDHIIWRANCPVGFVALSDFAKLGYDENTALAFKDIRCVAESQVTKGNSNGPFWDSQYAGASWGRMFIYKIRSSIMVKGTEPFFFARKEKTGQPPLYVIKP